MTVTTRDDTDAALSSEDNVAAIHPDPARFP